MMQSLICECAADITIERKFEPLESEDPWLWITFTVGKFFRLSERYLSLTLSRGGNVE